MIAAGKGLRVHANGRVVFGKAEEFPRAGPVGFMDHTVLATREPLSIYSQR